MSQSDSDIELEKEFKKFRLAEIPLKSDDEPALKTCNCATSVTLRSSLLELSVSSRLKTKDSRRSGSALIKPARLKVIGNCYAKKVKNHTKEHDESATSLIKNVDEFTSEAFLKMRISSTAPESPSRTESPVETLDKDEKLPSTSSLNCSTQAKLQQQMSTTETDSTIEEMSDFLAYHLSLFNHRDKFLIDSMYT